jgi:hypothetical protein
MLCAYFFVFSALLHKKWFVNSYPFPPPAARMGKNCAGFGSWLWDLWSVTDEKLYKVGGLDAVMFARFHLLEVKVFIFGACWAFLLVPLYFFSSSDCGGNLATAGRCDVDRFSLSNVPQGSTNFAAVLWATAIGASSLSFVVLHLMQNEYIVYNRWRRYLLSQPCPQNFVVLVRHLPPSLRSSRAASAYFQRMFPATVADQPGNTSCGLIQVTLEVCV